MDVDGVLTDGKIFLIPMADGVTAETKGFDVMDGAGIAIARNAGLRDWRDHKAQIGFAGDSSRRTEDPIRLQRSRRQTHRFR